MITTDALKYLPQMGLDPSRVVDCVGTKCQNSFALTNGFAVEAIVAEKCSIVFFCSLAAISMRSHQTVLRGRDERACLQAVCDHSGGWFGMVFQEANKVGSREPPAAATATMAATNKCLAQIRRGGQSD